MLHAAFIEVDNSREDADAGRRGLQDELAPVLRSMPGFVSTLLMTAYEKGLGVAIVVFDTRANAETLTSGVAIGSEIRPGVIVRRAEVLEVNAKD